MRTPVVESVADRGCWAGENLAACPRESRVRNRAGYTSRQCPTMTDRRSFVAWLGTLATALRWPRAASPTDPGGRTTPVVRATPTVLYRQPAGRSNLVRVTVVGLDAPAARARVTDRRVGVGG